jgi:hypothetical protein
MSFTVDLGRLRIGEWLALAGGVALFVSLFLNWFGFGGGDAFEGLTGGSTNLDGWDILVDLPGFIVILTAVVAIKFASLAALGMRINWGLSGAALTFVMGWLSTLIVLWRMANDGGGFGQLDSSLKFGVFLALAATLAITFGGWRALRDDGVDIVVSAGGRKRG